MRLTPRLQAISDLILPCITLADIGTDHGYVPIYCIKNGLAKTAIACDVRPGPLKIARANIEKFGMSGQIETRLSNGLEKLSPCEADTIVIAGMGGPLILEILNAGMEKIGGNTTLILQPMIAVSEVRRYLCKNGFIILNEALAKEEHKIYNVLAVRRGHEDGSEFDFYVGKRLLEAGGPLFEAYMEHRLHVVNGIIEGMRKSASKGKELDGYMQERFYYETALNIHKGR